MKVHEKGRNNSNGHFLEFLILYRFLYEGLDSNLFSGTHLRDLQCMVCPMWQTLSCIQHRWWTSYVLILYQFLDDGLDTNHFLAGNVCVTSSAWYVGLICILCDKHSLVFNIGDEHRMSWFCTNSYMKVWIHIIFWQETFAWPPVDCMWGWYTSHVISTLLCST